MKVLSRVVQVILSVLILFSLLLSVTSVILKITVFNPNYAEKIILTDKYIDQLYKTLETEIEKDTLLCQVQLDTIMTAVTRDSIIRYSTHLTDKFSDRLIHGDSMNIRTYENPELRDAISAELTRYAEENNIELQEDSIDSVYTLICNTVTGTVNLITLDSWGYLPNISRFRVLADTFYFPCILLLVCAAMLILFNKKRLSMAFYRILLPIGIASLILGIPAIMLKLYNIPNKLALAVSPLRTFVLSYLNATINIVFWTGLVMLIISVAALGYTVAYNAITHGKRYHKSRKKIRKTKPDDRNDGFDLVLK